MLIDQKANLSSKKVAPENAFVSLKNVNKIYENRVQAVYDFNIDIQKNEFIVFVGPSGCGKSTTLRMIAGLESITYGDLFIDGSLSNDLEPKERDIAMVFQSYALYPHMTVYDNLAFSLKVKKFKTEVLLPDGSNKLAINKKVIRLLEKKIQDLSAKEKDEIIQKELDSLQETLEYYKTTPVKVYKMKHMKKQEIDRRVKEAAEILELTPYLNRKPAALSGGQRQRVALGRAIVRNAKLFLMDEPLSNLDAKLRVQMRSEIVKLHNKVGATTIYVTHDQTEAMTMASRIVVMKDGYIQQIGTPKEIYSNPANEFVATFIGSPAMNLLDVTYNKKKIVFSDGTKIDLDYDVEKTVQTFIKNKIISLSSEIETTNDEIASLTEDDINRKDYLSKIIESKQKLISEYEASLENKQVRLGIRPEDIFHSEYIESKTNVTSLLKSKVVLSELLGHEYYAHLIFSNNEIIAKIPSRISLTNDEELKIVFSKDSIHLFDTISKGRII
ncbi:MAG: ATP-binding cassette domain-containing protein [Candidatus Onthovivens sp.]|nr:ATP-binding cassette domain-containing protein [Candidatus Onthovivens sp.]